MCVLCSNAYKILFGQRIKLDVGMRKVFPCGPNPLKANHQNHNILSLICLDHIFSQEVNNEKWFVSLNCKYWIQCFNFSFKVWQQLNPCSDYFCDPSFEVLNVSISPVGTMCLSFDNSESIRYYVIRTVLNFSIIVQTLCQNYVLFLWMRQPAALTQMHPWHRWTQDRVSLSMNEI